MITRDDLVAWLGKIDRKLQRNITLVAVGGTAMTLLSLKPSTIDVDFSLSREDKILFEKNLIKGWKVDLFVDGYIFSEQLPSDYIDKAKHILSLKHIELKALDPVDIVITKAARLNARDEEDIQALVAYVKKEELVARFEMVVGTYMGKEEDYRYHFQIILHRFFSK